MVLLKHRAAFAAIPRNKSSQKRNLHRHERARECSTDEIDHSGGILRHKITRKKPYALTISERHQSYPHAKYYLDDRDQIHSRNPGQTIAKEIVGKCVMDEKVDKCCANANPKKPPEGSKTKRRKFSLDMKRTSSKKNRWLRRHSSGELYSVISISDKPPETSRYA